MAVEADDPEPWLLPSQIPFDELKGRALEECLFWLLDGMGARDIEWRIGGAGGGAADGGRDLEARFFVPGDDGQIETRRWWIECKGRSGTLEKEAVTTACNNVLADRSVACLVIATNTTFSNPTRDWVRTWQERFPQPQILLWDRTSLERMLAQQPATVLRLFEGGLSAAGHLQALQHRFWQLIEYSSIEQVRRIWVERATLTIGPMERVALIANEFAHGSIDERPWGGACEPEQVLEACQLSIFNLLYFYTRLMKCGADEGPIVQTLSYLMLATLRHYEPALLQHIFEMALRTDEGEPMPAAGVDLLLTPILQRLQGDLQLVCSSDCQRFSREDSLKHWETLDAFETYWARFSERGVPPKKDNGSYHRLERTNMPCNVGFALEKDAGCPLYQTELALSDLEPFLDVATHVIRKRTPVRRRPKPEGNAFP